MSNYDSWEDDPAAQEAAREANLAQQTQQLNLGDNSQYGHAQGGYRPNAPSFRPDASAFQPGQQFVPQGNQGYYPPYNNQFGQMYPQYGQPNQYGQNNQYSQYGQYGQYGQHNNNYNNYPAPAGYPNQQHASHPQTILQNESHSQQPPAPAQKVSKPVVTSSSTQDTKPAAAQDAAPKPKAKVLSIAMDTPASEVKNKEKEEKAEKKSEPAVEPSTKASAKKAAAPSAKEETKPKALSGATAGQSVSKDGKSAEIRDAAAVEKEQAAVVDEETLKELYGKSDGKEHVNVIFLGHVDAGKSTLGGSILVATGMVDQRTLEKNKRDAKEMGRETWYLSWALDLTSEERSKGKTVETGKGFFETEKRKYTILDAPGHKNYVPSMINGASLADIGVLVISARKGEYETGFEKGGQTREHAMLAKTTGVAKLVVAVNKMDDPTAEWSQDRYKVCTTKVEQYLRGLGYNKSDVYCMPIAAQTGQGIKERVSKTVCPWWGGPSLLEYLDGMKSLERNLTSPFMMAVAGKYRDLGTMVEGKIEAGVVEKSMSLTMMPNKQPVEVSAIFQESENEEQMALCGSQVRLRLRGIEEDDILPGFVLCSPKRLVHYVSAFIAQIRIMEIPSIFTAGYNCVLHVHSAVEEVTVARLMHRLQKGTGRKSKVAPTHAIKGENIIARLEVTGGVGSVCVEKYEDYPQLGRFTLRNQGQTVAIGKIIELVTDEEAA